MRRTLGALALALFLVLAGCTSAQGPAAGPSGDGPPSDGPSADDPASAEGQAGAASGDPSTDGQVTDTPVTAWDRFSFEEGEYYRYRVDDRSNDRDVTITWEVLAVDGSEVTAEVTYEGETTYKRTLTGENASILWDLRGVDYESEDAEYATRTSGYLTLGPFSTLTAYFAHRDLTVGNEWILAGSEEAGYMTAVVEGTSEYAGLECYETAIRVPDGDQWTDSPEFESCIAPDASLALRTAYYDSESGEMSAEIVLEEYRRG